MKYILAAALIVAALGFFAFTQNSQHQGKAMIVILLGAPGSGKGTQAKMLAEKLNIPHISTGDLFRENLAQGTELGKEVRSYLEAGKLAPDATVIAMLRDRVANKDCDKGYLLDGFPRTLEQAKALDVALAKREKPFALTVINLEVSDEAIVKRIMGRLSCKECGAIYNRYFFPPKDLEHCDLCQGPLLQRTDDTEAVIEERLKNYHSQTAPLVDYYKEKGILKTVNGEQDPKEVFNQLVNALDSAQ